MFLEPNILRDFWRVIDSSEIFRESEKLKEKYNLICVVLDRLDSAIRYLNGHSEFPRTEEDFVCFLVYACMIKDAVTKLYENVYHRAPEYITQKKFFKDAKQYDRFVFDDENCPTDDVFFEYLRSMAFAHPFQTDKRSGRLFMDDKEKQYCPWVIVHENEVGIRVYTSSGKFDIRDITFLFENLKGYIKERYEHLQELTEWAKSEILIQDDEWSKHKVVRTEDIFETITSVKEILNERFCDTYTIDKIERCLKCDITVEENSENIKIYRDALRESIYRVCDALDNVNEGDLHAATEDVFARPRKAHQMMHYQLEKIMCYLYGYVDSWDRSWGLKQAKAFSKEFAKNWVVFDFEKMDDDEIILTVLTACYLEAKKQGDID